MKPTHTELELELHHTETELNLTKTELNQVKAELEHARELLKKASEEIGKFCDEVIKFKEQITRNSKNAPSPSPLIKNGTLTPITQQKTKEDNKTVTPFILQALGF